MHCDTLWLRIRGIALVMARIGGPGRFDEQERGGRLALNGHHRDAASWRIVINDLRIRAPPSTARDMGEKRSQKEEWKEWKANTALSRIIDTSVRCPSGKGQRTKVGQTTY